MNFKSERSRAIGFLIAVLSPAVIAASMAWSWPFFEANPVTIYLIAVIVSAWYGGLAPGLVSLTISFLLTNYYFIEPYNYHGIPDSDNLIRMGTVAAIGIIISGAHDLIRRERGRTQESMVSLRQSEERFRTTLERLLEG